MKKAEDQRQALLALMIEGVSQSGLGTFSLRDLAAAAGLSTTAIFQNFSGKADLLESAMELAMERDQAFHKALAEQARGLLSTHISFAQFLAGYVLRRASSPEAAFLSELLLAVKDYPRCHDRLQEWHQRRTDFWAGLLAPLEARQGLATVVAQFVLMEEYYALALKDDCTYAMLLAEACRAISDAAFHHGASSPAQSHVSLKLDTQPMSFREAEESGDAPMKEHLLNEAIRIIEESGIESLNQRRIARRAGVSTSAIAYHFNDMKTFRNRAIWRTLVRGIPSQFDPGRTQQWQPEDLGEWLATLDDLLDPRDGNQPSGFYIGAARLAGQACLLSRHDSALLPLIAYLRSLEGWGTYRVSRHIAPLADLIRREHAAAFGVWIKSEALLRRAALVPPGLGLQRLEFAARQIFPERPPAVN